MKYPSNTVFELGKLIIENLLGQRASDFLRSLIRVRRMKAGKFTEQEITLVNHVLRSGDVAIDVGAYAGEYAYRMSGAVGGTGTVLALEAFPRYAKLLKTVLSKLSTENTEIIAEAVADEPGHTWLTHSNKSGKTLAGEVHLTSGNANTGNNVHVPVTTLDIVTRQRQLQAHVRLLKIDVEGAERKVIRGAKILLTTSKPVLICEIEDRHCARYGHTRLDVLSDLVALGYYPFKWNSENSVLETWSDNQTNPNIVFVHESVCLETINS